MNPGRTGFAYAAIAAMTLAWLPAIWISFFFALWAFGVYRPSYISPPPPWLLAGAFSQLILLAGMLAASLWLSLKALRGGRAGTALISSGISCLLGAGLSFFLASSIPF